MYNKNYVTRKIKTTYNLKHERLIAGDFSEQCVQPCASMSLVWPLQTINRTTVNTMDVVLSVCIQR